MNRSLVITLTLLIAIGGASFWWMNRSNTTPLGIGAAVAQDADVDLSLVREMVMGDENAPVTIVEYSSFTCPHCKNFHLGALRDLKSNYIDTGKVKFVFREVYFDRFGLWAGMVARCGGPDRYFGITDLIFEQQADWVAGGDPALIAANLRTIGKTAGIGEAELEQCFNDSAKAQAMVAVYQQNAKTDDVRATPSFVINGENYSNMNYADFAAIIDEKLGE